VWLNLGLGGPRPWPLAMATGFLLIKRPSK
jgi:hypothetical protein